MKQPALLGVLRASAFVDRLAQAAEKARGRGARRRASPTVPVLLAVVAGLALLVTFTAVPDIVVLPEQFLRAIRATGMSIVYCLGVSIFGGFAQFFATWLIEISGNNLSPAWYLIGCASYR